MDTDRTTELLERIAIALEKIAAAGSLPTADPQAQTNVNPAASRLPTFAGHAASWTVDAAGLPSYIIDPTTGELAAKHERQGDVWYSVQDEAAKGGYRRLLTIKAGETLPEQAQWTPPTAQQAQAPKRPQTPPTAHEQAQAQTPPPARGGSQTKAQAQTHIDKAKAEQARPLAEAPDADNPFTTVDEPTLRRLHDIGRQAHGEQWREVGPERIVAHSDGRAAASSELSHAEAIRLINELTAAVTKSPAYAG